MDVDRKVLVGIACSAAAPAMACMITNPADVCKTRLNMDRELTLDRARQQYRGVVDCFRQTWRAEGVRGVQRGLLFALVRESSKNTFRIGFYEPVADALDAKRKREGGKGGAPMSTRLLAGGMTGSFSALVCNPLDLLKTRMQLRAGAHGVGGGLTPTPTLTRH